MLDDYYKLINEVNKASGVTEYSIIGYNPIDNLVVIKSPIPETTYCSLYSAVEIDSIEIDPITGYERFKIDLTKIAVFNTFSMPDDIAEIEWFIEKRKP